MLWNFNTRNSGSQKRKIFIIHKISFSFFLIVLFSGVDDAHDDYYYERHMTFLTSDSQDHTKCDDCFCVAYELNYEVELFG